MRLTTKTLMCGLSALTLLAAGGAASAQTAPMKSGDAMASDHMKMSKSQMKKMKKCMAMGHDKMMADKKCEAMADKHPDMMKDGMMKSDGMMKK